MPSASPRRAGAPRAGPPQSGRRLYRLCLEVAAFWWALSTSAFVVIMALAGLASAARRVSRVDLLLPVGMFTRATGLAGDEGAAAVLAMAFIIGLLLTAVSLWEGTAPFLLERTLESQLRGEPHR